MSASPRAQVGVIGMVVMGSNLARNFARHGVRTAVYNRTLARTRHVIDAVIDELIPLLEEGDIVVDGGNAH